MLIGAKTSAAPAENEKSPIGFIFYAIILPKTGRILLCSVSFGINQAAFSGFFEKVQNVN